MSRGYTSAMATEIAQGSIRPVVFVEIAVNGGTRRWWTGQPDVSWNGSTWTGGGELLDVQPAEETADVHARGARIRLAATSANLSMVLQDLRHGLELKVWLGALDSSEAIIADPVLWFAGLVDGGRIHEGGDTGWVEVVGESKLRDLDRARGGRRTHEGQLAAYPGDLFLEYLQEMDEWSGQWGTPWPGQPWRVQPQYDPTHPDYEDPFVGEGDEPASGPGFAGDG